MLRKSVSAALASLCWLLFIGGLMAIACGWAAWKLADYLIERWL
jgi:hypothetical protein